MTKLLVTARYRESIDWLKLINFDILVYNKGIDDIPQPYVKLRNVGHETDTYMHHIISHYDNLSDVTVFCQGNPFDHGADFVDVVNNTNDIDNVIWLGTNWGPITKDYQGGPGERALPMLDMCEMLFNEKYDTTKTFTFSAGAQYMVPRKYIINKSLEWWKNAHTIFDAHIETAGWVFERLWPMVWNYSDK
jgi:hypothetical protein